MRRNGNGGQLALSGGDPTAVADPPDWAAATDYVLDNVVTVGSGNTAVQARCVLGHTATSTGLSVTAGVLGGADAGNWRLIQKGSLVALRNWSFDQSETETTIGYVIETDAEGDRTVGTAVSVSGQIVVADNDEEGFDVAQRALTLGNRLTANLYPKGVGTGRPVWTGSMRIGPESGAYSTEVQERTFAFSATNWVRTRQA